MSIWGPNISRVKDLSAGTVESESTFRGYELINPAFTQASVALLERMGVAELLSRGAILTAYEQRARATNTRYLQAALDWLTVQGFLEGGEERSVYRVTESGRDLLSQASIIRRTVDTYTQIKDVMKWEAGISDLYPGTFLEPVDHSPEGITNFWAGVAPVAASFAHEAYVPSGEHQGQRAGEVLRSGHALLTKDLCDGLIRRNRLLFMDVLRDIGVLDKTEQDGYVATERGKKLLQLGGYAELTLSYYEMLQHLYPLMRGEETYGLEGTVHRDPELNARASNGIITIKVAPYLVNSLSSHEVLRDALNGGGAYIDYGSGGADMLMQAAENGPDTLGQLYGIDINPRTNDEARKILDEKGMNGRVELVTGSIVDEESLREVAEQMKARGIQSGVASINFILHDIGPELAKVFLKAHATVFPQVPLMVTETLRMPLDVCRAYPNYQQSSFQFMHTASGQHLYSEQELRDLLGHCGYDIKTEKVHSSMPNVDGTERLSTIVTWITSPR